MNEGTSFVGMGYCKRKVCSRHTQRPLYVVEKRSMQKMKNGARSAGTMSEHAANM